MGTKERKHECGLCQTHFGQAIKIVGPFNSMKEACEARARLEQTEPMKGWKWWTAWWGEITRRPDCEVREPKPVTVLS